MFILPVPAKAKAPSPAPAKPTAPAAVPASKPAAPKATASAPGGLVVTGGVAPAAPSGVVESAGKTVDDVIAADLDGMGLDTPSRCAARACCACVWTYILLLPVKYFSLALKF